MATLSRSLLLSVGWAKFQWAKAARAHAAVSVKAVAAKDTVLLMTIGCGTILRIDPAPDAEAALTPAVNVSVVTPATVNTPEKDPAAGSTPPNFCVTTTESPFENPCAGTVRTLGLANVPVNGSHLKLPR